MLVIGLGLIVSSLFLLYEFLGVVFSVPILYNMMGITNLYFQMTLGVVLKWSVVLGFVGLIMGLFVILGLNKASESFSSKNKIICILFLVVNVVSSLVLVI